MLFLQALKWIKNKLYVHCYKITRLVLCNICL